MTNDIVNAVEIVTDRCTPDVEAAARLAADLLWDSLWPTGKKISFDDAQPIHLSASALRARLMDSFSHAFSLEWTLCGSRERQSRKGDCNG